MMIRYVTTYLERAARCLRAAIPGPQINWVFRGVEVGGFVDAGPKTPMPSASNRSTPEWTLVDSPHPGPQVGPMDGVQPIALTIKGSAVSLDVLRTWPERLVLRQANPL
jgi:hypothetical protein